jgi:signal transduction histidine kinase
VSPLRQSGKGMASRSAALRRLADQVLEAVGLEALARLLTSRLPDALGVRTASLLIWDRKLDSFQALLPGETRLTALRPGEDALSRAGFLLSEGALLETPGGDRRTVLVPLMARSGLVGMLILAVPQGRRRKAPFRPPDVRTLSLVAARAALTLENHLYQQELVASERLAALGALAGMLAHDIRNPLTVIRGNADLLMRPDLPQEVRARAETIARTADRLDRMTGETLDFARAGGVLARRGLKVAAWLTEVATGLEQELPGLVVVPDVRLPDGFTASLDADKLWRAMANIAANARDAMGGQGRVHLAAWPEGGERLVLVLGDEGPGIPAELRDRIFEPFVTRGKKRGTGLGLAIARRFVEDHGGRLDLLLDTPPEGGPSGACFRIALPLGTEAPSAGPAGGEERNI